MTGTARLWLRYTWDDRKPIAAFLMNNPSVAGSESSDWDNTARRTVHFADLLGAGAAWLVNWCPLVATYPDDLWPMIGAGKFNETMQWSNGRAVERAGREATFRVVACGPQGFRRYPDLVKRALQAFLWAYPPAEQKHEAMCLGVSGEGAPLHPLARGKMAIRNGTMPRRWTPSWMPGPPYGSV